MTNPLWLKNPLSIFTSNTRDARAGLVVDGSKIIELVPQGQDPKTQNVDVFDASQHVILPGLVNAHHHFYQTLTRAFPAAINKPLFPWLTTLYPVWAKLTTKQIALSTELALAELLLSGCTTASDHHYLFTDAISDAIDIQAETATKMGVRVQLTRGSMSLGKDQGGLPPQVTVQSEETIIDDSLRLIEKFHDDKDGAMIKLSLAPCSPFSVTQELMIESAKIAREHGLSLHTHLAETNDENSFCLEKLNLRPLDYLEKVGWLAEDVWLAHGIHFNDQEVKRLGEAQVGICHCPSSNMILASGICRGLELEQAGAKIGIGVDGSASNDGSNMINELRQALLIHRLRYDANQVTHMDILRWATKGSAACFGRTDIGELAPGKQADIAMFKLDEPRFSGAGDPLAALILCGAQTADRTMVNGKWRVIDGQLVDVDLEKLLHNHHQSAMELQCD